MKKSLFLAIFMLTALVWAGAQQPSMPPSSGAQAGAPGSAPPQSAAPGAAGQSAPEATPQSGASGQAGNITEGCLGGTSPNFTLTDSAGKTYKLNLPPNADGSKLAPHVGESVQVMGDVTSNSINVSKVGKGTGTCPAK